MRMGTPLHSLTCALQHALEAGLCGVPSELATQRLGPRAGGVCTRRPYLAECEVVLFGQTWSAEQLGMDDAAPRHIEGECVIVLGPVHDACVYFAGRLAYHIVQPNRRFYLDAAAHAMAPVGLHPRYDGPDDEEAESVDCATLMQLATLHAQLQLEHGERAALVAGLLRSFADKFQRLGCGSAEKSADR